MNILEMAAVDVGIDLCCGDIGMTEHHLHGPQVSAVFKQVGGKGVPQGMRGYPLVYPSVINTVPDDLPEPQPGHRPAAIGNKEEITGPSLQDPGTCQLKIGLYSFFYLFSERHQPFLAALAKNTEMAAAKIQPRHPQRYKLGHPETGGIQDMQHGDVTEHEGGIGCNAGGGEQPGNFVNGQTAGKGAAEPGRFYKSGRILTDDLFS